jgi:hypothetical protein
MSARYPESMKEKSKKEKDKEVKEAIDFAAERVVRLLWDHWMWLEKERENSKKDKS